MSAWSEPSWGAEASWPTAFQNPQRNAVSTEPFPAGGLERLWSYDAGAPLPAWYGPAKWDAWASLRDLHSMRNYDIVPHAIIADGYCYFGSTVDHSVTAINLESGKVAWRFFTQGPVRIAPTWYAEKLYFGSDDGYAYCIAAADGELIWKMRADEHVTLADEKTAGASQDDSTESEHHRRRLIVNNGNFIPRWPVRTGVAVVDGTAYFAASLLPWQVSYLCAIDATTGKADGEGHWVRKLESATLEGPLAISQDLIIAPQGRVAPVLYSRRDGAKVGALEGGGGAFVVVAGEEVIHGPGNKSGWMTRSNVNTRERLATHQQARAVVVRDSVSYILTKGVLLALPAGSKKPLWQTPVEDPLSMIATRDTLLVGGVDQVQAIDLISGLTLWSQQIEGRAIGLAYGEGKLLVASDTGAIDAFRPLASATPATRPQDMSTRDAANPPLAAPEPIDDADMTGRWVFQRPMAEGAKVEDLAGGHHGSSPLPLQIVRDGKIAALEIREPGQSIAIPISDRGKLPTETITVEAWARVDEVGPGGAIAALLGGEGDQRRGWILGYRKKKFGFAFSGEAGETGLSYASSDVPLGTGQWYHLVGVYDGKEARMYVDGRNVGRTTSQQGPLDVADADTIEIGAYRDSGIDIPMNGAIHEVRLYRRVLSEEEIRSNYQAKFAILPTLDAQLQNVIPVAKTHRVDVGPWLSFTAPGEATISWQTATAEECTVELKLDGRVTSHQSETSNQHELTLTGLKHNRVYHYRILTADGERATDWYECDTFFDYNRAVPTTEESKSELVTRLLKSSPFDRGLCLIISPDAETLARETVARSRFNVIGLVKKKQEADAWRKNIANAKLGSRINVYSKEELGDSWMTPWSIQAIIAAGEPLLSEDELNQLIVPKGVAHIQQADNSWKTITGVEIEGAGEWSHAYGKADNSSYGGETLAGARRTDELGVQWIGRPGPRYQSDRQNRKPPPLAVGGRIYLQGLDRMIATDLYNGTVLWSLEMPFLRRYNIPRDCANWCADDDFLYVALRDRLLKIDGRDGNVEIRKVDQRGLPPADYEWSYVASEQDLIIGSAVRAGTARTEFWGGEYWFDAIEGPSTFKACSDHLYASNKATGEVVWRYRRGLIMNSTISISDGKILFVDCRDAELEKETTRLIGSEALWRNQFLVSLDARTGEVLWEQPLNIIPGTVMLNVAASRGKIVLVSSHPKNFHIYTVDAATGKELWTAQTPWPDGRTDHGIHLARPAIVADRLYLRPTIFDMQTGEAMSETFPLGGCGTYACTESSLLFRSGSGGELSLWTSEPGGYTQFKRIRPDCWLSSIPAGGLLLSPEGGGGCSCGNWLETSLTFVPKVHLEEDNE